MVMTIRTLVGTGLICLVLGSLTLWSSISPYVTSHYSPPPSRSECLLVPALSLTSIVPANYLSTFLTQSLGCRW